MPLSTVALGAALTPTVVSTWIHHYTHRKRHHTKPTIHISYDEGIHIVRGFLLYAAKHTVEDIQEFTNRSVPNPYWVRTEDVYIPDEYLSKAATAIIDELGPKGVAQVGGQKWWQWRGPSGALRCQWVEMRSDYEERKKSGAKCNRVMLYVHGGAYFFGSLETHRYQMQRHARKLKARVFARESTGYIRFPFPCSLQDCLAAYLYLLSIHSPSEILLAGDSAGGGMVLSMLVTIRDRGLPLPAGGILLSPWVDLTHSFPSIVQDHPGDYIPPYGFRQKPSAAWPPPNSDELAALKQAISQGRAANPNQKARLTNGDGLRDDVAASGYTVHDQQIPGAHLAYPGLQSKLPEAGDESAPADSSGKVFINIDGKTVELKDQIQFYAPNHLLSHPLVSPILQPSLGGLPPLLIQSGGGEMLQDEQFYLAHKAAHPTAYPPSETHLDEYDPNREMLHKYKPTYVQLQVWDDLCHVAPTLSFTRPAKHMYRAIAQFGAWALARAQSTAIDIDNDPNSSPGSSEEGNSSDADASRQDPASNGDPSVTSVGKAGDPLPPFHRHMIRQRVDKRGRIHPLKPESEYPVLHISPSQIGSINPQLVKKWLDGKAEWDVKFAKVKLKVQKQRLLEMANGYGQFDGETPPPSALAARRDALAQISQKRPGTNYGMMLWGKWASKHEKELVEKKRRQPEASRQAKSAGVDAGQAPDHPLVDGNGSKCEDPQQRAAAQQPPEGITPEIAEAGGENANAEQTSDLQPVDANGHTGDSEPRASDFLSPTIIFTDGDDKSSGVDNASTRALYHEKGTIPAAAGPNGSREARPSPLKAISSTGTNGSAAYTDDASTINDRDTATIRSTVTEADANASTTAVMNSGGVISPASNGATTHASPLSESKGTRTLDTAAQGISRPEMPDREVFETAQEHLK